MEVLIVILTIAYMGHALCRGSYRKFLFNLNFFSNHPLLVAVFTTIAVQMLAVYMPFFNDLFNTNLLTLGQLAICLVLSTIVFWTVELEKC